MSDPGGWDQRYAAAEHLFSTEPDDALVELVSPLPPGRAADLGSGEGRNTLWLARHGWQVVAVDGSGVALDRLRAAAASEGLAVRIIHADIGQALSQGERFDLVVVANVHPAPGERDALIHAAAAAVGPGGHLFVTGHHLDSLGRAGPPDPARLYTEPALAGAVTGLRLIRLERRERARGGDTGLPVVDLVLWAEAAEVGLA